MTTIVIMPGGFHPFHAGHYALYQSAQRAFPGAEVFVAATNDTSARPFPFAVKEKLAKLAGVAPGHFVQVRSPFRAEEITSKFDPARDRLIFVRSEKDANKPPQAGGVKRDGSAAYLQPLAGQTNIRPFKEHAYMAYLPTVEFGPGMTSATEIRTAWPALNEKRKTALVMSLYPQTQGNLKLADIVVKLLDAAIGGEQGVAEGLEQKYLWHGSRQKIPMLEPRQSVDTGGAAGSNQNAIYATSDPKVAIAMGLTTPGSDTGMFPNDPQMVLFKGNIRKGENVYLHKVLFNGPDGKPQFVQGDNSREFHTIPSVKGIKPVEIKAVPVDKYLNLIRQATPADLELQKKYMKQGVAENFADGRNPQDKGDAKRHGINTKASVSSLRKTAKQGGRKGQLAHWLANMKAGRAKNEDVDSDYIEEKWSAKYKSSINCADPKGFSQKAHCAGRKK
jgi:hypothetical protein